MLQVLVICQCYPTPEQPYVGAWTHKHVRQLAMAGCSVQVLTVRSQTLTSYFKSPAKALRFWSSPPYQKTTWEGIPVHTVRAHLGLPTQYSLLAPTLAMRAIRPVLAKIHETFPFDRMLAWTGEYLALAAARVARQLRAPFIATATGSDVNLACQRPGSLRYRVEHELFRLSKRVLCVSSDLKKKVLAMTDGQAQAQTLYPGLDLELFRKDPTLRHACRRKMGFPDHERVLMYVGNLKTPKGIYDLLDAFAIVARRDPSLRLALVGEPVERRRILRRLQALDIASRVTMTGGMAPEELPSMLNASDLFVFPSWMEGLPNAVMEACACELPVIATRVGGIPELIEDRKSGLLVEPRDAAGLARGIESTLRDPERASAMGRAARDRMLDRFCWVKNGEKMFAAIRDV